jgi:hypothetical protein
VIAANTLDFAQVGQFHEAALLDIEELEKPSGRSSRQQHRKHF